MLSGAVEILIFSYAQSFKCSKLNEVQSSTSIPNVSVSTNKCLFKFRAVFVLLLQSLRLFHLHFQAVCDVNAPVAAFWANYST